MKWESLESDSRSDVWENWPGAVLLDDEIRHYCLDEPYKLIEPFHEENLKPARYVLTLGSPGRVGGTDTVVDKDHPLVIPPHQVAIVRTQETLNIPRFLIGRWNLSVDNVYRGLLWVGALQVDPGWVGYLPCPVYNLSDQPVALTLGERLFTIDFVRTTKFSDSCLRYPNKPTPPPINPSIGFYDPNRLRSGPYEALAQLRELTHLRNFGIGAFGLMFVVISAVVAALAVVAVKPTVDPGGPFLSFWPMAALVLAFLAFALSAFTLGFVWKIWRRTSTGR